MSKKCPYSDSALVINTYVNEFRMTLIPGKMLPYSDFASIRICGLDKKEKICKSSKNYNQCIEYLNKSKKNLSVKVDWDIT